MPRKRYEPEEIARKRRQVDLPVSLESSVADAIRRIGVSEVAYYRRCTEFCGRKTKEAGDAPDFVYR